MKPYLLIVIIFLTGCSFAPSERLSFPDHSMIDANNTEWFDINGNGKPEFAITATHTGQADQLLYDDNEDGKPDRIYRLADYDPVMVPHVVLLLDSVPFQSMLDRYEKRDFRWFTRPQKVISVFPSLTEVCYTELFHSPPLPGMIDTQYDPRLGKYRNDLWDRIRGIEQPWERCTHYHASYLQHGLSFINPHDWYGAELSKAYRAINQSADHVTYVYFASAASLSCKYGQQGIDEVLSGARKLCLKLLYERYGAIQLSMMADHGHNLLPSKNISIESIISHSGFHVTNSLKTDQDVVVSVNGLVTCAAIHTYQAEKVSEALIKEPSIELATYREGDRVIVRSSKGMSAIEARGTKTRYLPLDSDVLSYAAVIERMRISGACDADGFAEPSAWLDQTSDHQWPAAPVRLWDAFGRLFESPPTIIISMKDGYCAGKPEYEKWIKMQSTHGGLNQINSATFITTMRRSIEGALLQRDALDAIEPNNPPRVLR